MTATGESSTQTAPDFAAMLSEFNIYADDAPDVADELLEYARTKCPVPHSNANGGYHLVTRYDDVRAVLTNDAVFSSTGGKSLPSHQLLVMPPIDVDPPIQNEFRRLLNKYFSKAGLAKSEPAIRAIARQLVDGFVEAGEADILADYATPLTSATLCKVVLNLEDEELARTAISRVEGIGASNRPEAWQELTGFLTELMNGHQPSGTDNVLDAVMAGQVEGRPLTDDERLGVIVILFLGGLDTTRAAISAIVNHLIQEPGLEDRLRDPDWVKHDLDEFLRFDSVVTALARRVTGDTELGGAKLHEGDRVLVHYWSADHDSERFENADRLDFTRESNPHLAFGVGVHRCLGSNLARLQIRIAFEELLARVQNIRAADASETVRFTPGVSRMPRHMRVAFDKR